MSEYNHRECENTMDSDAYAVHVNAMTAEGLHRKSEIALELAARDNRIAELEAERRWIPVEEGLPECKEKRAFFVCTKNGSVQLSWYSKTHGWDFSYVAYWMHTPSPTIDMDEA